MVGHWPFSVPDVVMVQGPGLMVQPINCMHNYILCCVPRNTCVEFSWVRVIDENSIQKQAETPVCSAPAASEKPKRV